MGNYAPLKQMVE